MATAPLHFPNLLEAFHALLDWMSPGPAPERRPVWNGPVRRPPVQPQEPARALRVVRVVEPSVPRAGAGRMVISGRMADVCAELDRLAAQEARLH